MDDDEAIQRACATLSTMLHCKSQARALHKCRREMLGAGAACQAQEAAFVTCSQAHVGLVVQHLAKIAESHCPSEMIALQRCRTLNPGADCEYEDMAAIKCASVKVLAAAAADSRAGNNS